MFTKKDITTAFRELRKKGYFAKQNFMCCRTCGWDAVPEEKAEKAVFYHHQDTDRAFDVFGNLVDELYLSWSGDGVEISNVFINLGMKAIWDGSQGTRIKILPE
jgi:hypothetical protein